MSSVIKINRLSHHKKLQLWAVIFFLPAVIFLVGFLVIPILISARMSLYQYSLVNESRSFLGLENYVFALQDPKLLNSFKVTGQIILMKEPLQIILSMGVAMLVNRRIFGIGVIQSLPLMATVMPMSIAAILWRMMYHPSNGIINSIIRLFGIAPLSFLRDPEIALPAIVGMMVWKDIGFYMIIFLAGLQGIDREFYEAAMVDGATALQKFWYITLPMLRRTITIVLIISTTFAFQMFIPAYVMTDGGPRGATDVIVFYIYRMGFRFFRMGYANALTIILLVFVIILMAFQYWLSAREA